jgi:hypothetical protein
MRLSPHQRQVLVQTARVCFDPHVQVRLFGSGPDDARRGGDIDLLIDYPTRQNQLPIDAIAKRGISL